MPLQAATFFVYLSRLALWEHLFYQGSPPMQAIAHATQALGSVSENLRALGLMAGRLLIGNDQGNPANLQIWPEDLQVRALYLFVCRLMGEGSHTLAILKVVELNGQWQQLWSPKVAAA